MSNFYIFQGGPETKWLIEDGHFPTFFWTANKHVKKGEIAFIYLTAPISKIVGAVRITGEPFFNPAATSMFDNPFMYDKWCVEVGEVNFYGEHESLSMKNLRKLFATDWGWVRYPRGSTRIPDEIMGSFYELIAPYCKTISIKIEIPEVAQ